MTLDPHIVSSSRSSTTPALCLEEIILQLPASLHILKFHIRESHSPNRRFRQHLTAVNWPLLSKAMGKIRSLCELRFSLFPSPVEGDVFQPWTDELAAPILGAFGHDWSITGQLFPHSLRLLALNAFVMRQSRTTTSRWFVGEGTRTRGQHMRLLTLCSYWFRGDRSLYFQIRSWFTAIALVRNP